MATQPVFQPSHSRYMPTNVGFNRKKTTFQRMVNGIGDFLLEYWAHTVTALLGLVVAIAIAIPFLSYFGLESISAPLSMPCIMCVHRSHHILFIFMDIKWVYVLVTFQSIPQCFLVA